MPELHIVPLGDDHDRQHFDCGEPVLDRYLREVAGQHARRDLARTFVLIEQAAPARILGYFTLTICTVDASNMPSDLARKLRHTLPGVKLGRLAFDRSEHGKGYGTRLLMRSLAETVAIADRAGSYALFVDAKHDGVVPFYRAFGFIALPSQPLTLFMPTASIRKLIDRR